MSRHPNLRDVLLKNPQIDLGRVEQFEAYRAEMSRVGVNLAPEYRIAPPIGSPPPLPCDQTAQRGQHLLSWGKG